MEERDEIAFAFAESKVDGVSEKVGVDSGKASGLVVVRVSRYVMINDGELRPLAKPAQWTVKDASEKTGPIIGGKITDVEEFRRCLKIQDDTPMYWGRTFFRKRLYLAVRYRGDDFYTRYYADELKSLVAGDVYTPVDDFTLQDLMKLCPMDDAIAYLKSKGIAVCPLG